MSDVSDRLNAALSGRYAIEREVGAGGMATVFLAHDARHARRVAVKVLDPELGAVLGADRFLAEIKVTANLLHPNLLPLFDSGIADGLLYYVMPFVDGESLATRLDREKQLPVEEAVRIVIAVADALDYAHAHGIVHRDLKPANILLQHGQPLVADFGIALAVSNAGGTRITQTGLSLGTPHYMSPEQATGDRAIDARSDVYSLACVGYEMLTGEPPHTGTTAQAIIARLLTETPRRVRTARPTVPEAVDAAVARALEKLPADRFATAREFAQALRGIGVAPTDGRISAVASQAPDRHVLPSWGRRGARAAPWVGLAAALGILTWRELAKPVAPAPRTVRFVLDVPASLPLSQLATQTLTISDDGNAIAYTTAQQPSRVAVRRLDQLTTVTVPGVEGVAQVRFLPGGRALMVRRPMRIDRVPLDGSAATTIAPVGNSGMWGSVGPSGEIVLGNTDGTFGLSVVGDAGGTLRQLSRPDTLAGESSQRNPVVLADGRTVLYLSWTTSTTARIGVADLRGAPTAILPVNASCVLGFIEGHIIYVRIDGSLMAVPVDLQSRRVLGDPIGLERNVAINYTGGGCRAALAANGTLTFIVRPEEVTPILVSQSGAVRAIDTTARTYRTPRFSPDGRRLAFTVTAGSSTDIWLYELATGTPTRLTNDGRSDRPEWSPDGRRLVFRSARDGATALWEQRIDGSSTAQKVTGIPPNSHHGVFTPDGRGLVVRTFSLSGKTEIYFAPLNGGGTPRLVVSPSHGYTMAQSVSPDGRWLAYNSDETGAYEVYAIRLDGGGTRYQISTAGGTEPIWSQDGRRLFYRDRLSGKLLAATLALPASDALSGASELAVLRRDVVIDPTYRVQSDAVQRSYDLSPDGTQFLMLRESDEPNRIVVVLNWASELHERLAAASAQSTGARDP